MSNNDNIHTGHRQRLRNRAFKEGLDGFASHEVLELLLFNIIPYKNTNELSHKLIDKYGSITGVLNAPVEELAQFENLGKQSAANLALMKEIFRYYRQDRIRNDTQIKNLGQLLDYAVAALCEAPNEELVLLCLDSECRILHSVRATRNSPTTFGITIREIVEINLRYKSSYCVFMHSHPRGDVFPSPSDDNFTEQAYDYLATIDVGLIDHIIVSGEKTYSYNVATKISKYYEAFKAKKTNSKLMQPTIEGFFK